MREIKLIALEDRKGNRKSPNWYIYDNSTGDDRRISTGCRIGEQDEKARTALAQYITNRNTTSTPQNAEEVLVAIALKNYWEEKGQYAIGANAEKFVAERLKKSTLYPLFVSQITQGKIDTHVREGEKKGLSLGTIRKDLEHLRAALNYEEGERRLLRAPKIKLPDRPPARERILSLEEIHKSLDFCKSDHIRNTILLMLNTGQRPNAIEKLTWFQVNFDKGIIEFPKGKVKQTKKRVRSVYMNELVYNLLKELYEKRTTEFVIEQVFKNKAGEVTKTRPAGCVKKGIKAVFLRMGIMDAGRYTLRHTFANLCDGDAATRTQIMGHTSTETTEWHYLKVNKDKHLNSLGQVGALFNFPQNFRKSENQAI